MYINSENSLEKNYTKCLELIEASENLVISTHMNPDGDAIGSALALYYYAVQKGKNAEVLINGPLPYNLEFVIDDDNCKIYEDENHRDIILNADTIIIVDLNDSKRLLSVESAVLESKAKKIVIDHHLEPKEFADFYLVDSEACSAGEIVWKLLAQDKAFSPDQKFAEALYLAIMTDTGSFRFPRTDAEVHEIIARLIDAGADPVYIYEEAYNKNPFQSMKLLGEAFAGMELFHGGKLCVMSLRKEHFERSGANEDDVEGFVEKTLHAKGVEMGILMTEIKERNEIRNSFRSKGDISVRDIAIKFGGGGHKNAAGARVKDYDFDQLKAEIIEFAGEALK